jgi:pimeloyl-ACP methyl ester carboxylesterase
MTTREFSFPVFVSPQGRRLAWRAHPAPAGGVTFVWLSGFNSDMTGTKAQAVEAFAKDAGHGFLAFDYSGHGASGGAFADGTLTAWRDDALSVIDAKSEGPLILAGSSMGGWIAVLAALARPERVRALVLIAPAPDFTEALLWPSLSAAQQAEILNTGQTLRPSAYGAPYPITRALIEDGRRWLLLDAPIRFDGPVHILQGMKDADVPWHHALRLIEQLTTPQTVLTLIGDGDHRLSRPQDIARLLAACNDTAARA